jgi:hypothetical protein
VLNKKPVGPPVDVRAFYDRNQVFHMPATDDDRVLAGLEPKEQAIQILRIALNQAEAEIEARPAEVALFPKKEVSREHTKQETKGAEGSSAHCARR